MQEEWKSRHDWVRKVINGELCKKIKLYQTMKWYIQKPKFELQNETNKFLWDLEIQTDHRISIKRPGQGMIFKKVRIWHQEDFAETG